MKYRWAQGFHAPKGVTVDEVGAAIEALPQPTPEALFNASKRKRHVLHKELWSEGDQVWANRARLDRCRHIIKSVKQVYEIGEREIEIRAVEFLHDDKSQGLWASMNKIIADKTLHAAYISEILRLQNQATMKLEGFRALLSAQE